ncbi:MAG TPA: SLBB domain-containing protein [Fimbriimonadaceae bacterium]|nr:SLBB domain-containing protein [Fimbriimonadaceae bacterium]
MVERRASRQLLTARALSFLGLLLFAAAAWTQVKVEPGDALRLETDADPALCGVFRIQIGGSTLMPGIGPMDLAGLTLPQVQEVLKDRLVSAGYPKTATLQVRLVALPDMPVRFRGAVLRSGTVPFREGLRLSQVAALASPTEAADLQEVEITSAAGERVTVAFDPSDPTSGDPLLRPGDRVYFALRNRTSDVSVLGGVLKPGPIRFVPGLTVRSAIAYAGGLHPDAQMAAIVVEREGRLVSWVDWTAGDDAPLERGDVVKVPRKEEGPYVLVIGLVRREGRVSFRSGLTLTQAIRGAGGGLSNADLSRVQILRRINGNLKRFTFDLAKIDSREVPDPELQMGDVVDVPVLIPKDGGG